MKPANCHRRLLALAFVAISWATLSGFSGDGRFGKYEGSGPILTAVTQLRGLIRPLYEMRGWLFLLRLELLAAKATPDQKRVIEPWLEVSLADAGWLAFEMNKAVGAKSKAAQDETVKNLADVLSKNKKENDATKKLFRQLIRGEAGDYAKSHEATADELKSHIADPQALARLKRLAGGPKTILESWAQTVRSVPKVVGSVSKALSSTAKEAQKAAKGDGAAAAGTAVDVLVGLNEIDSLMTDVNRLPRLVKAMEEEATALGSALPSLGTGVPELASMDLGQLVGSFADKDMPVDKITDLISKAIELAKEQ